MILALIKHTAAAARSRCSSHTGGGVAAGWLGALQGTTPSKAATAWKQGRGGGKFPVQPECNCHCNGQSQAGLQIVGALLIQTRTP